MAEYREQRRLSAIVAADVAGYTQLVERDTDGTVAAWKVARDEVFEPAFSRHGGRIVKLTGDGFLGEFSSIQSAVAFAIDVQTNLAGGTLEFRMGVHLGDVVDDGRDIHGEGVNIAARLEALAEPGSVNVSGAVYEVIRNRVDARFEDLGEHEVKNVTSPIRVWRWTPSNSTPDAALRDKGRATVGISSKPSIAVLPFNNMSGDPEQDYFADGMAEDIITALSKIPRVRVIARNSTFAYKGKAIDLRKMANDLGVRHVLEGSVRSAGNRLRITAQLIDAHDGTHVWAERFDRTLHDIFDIQDEITKEIVTSLRVTLTDGEEARVLARGTNNIEAWQLCVRAIEQFSRFSPANMANAENLATQAIQHDPNYAYAWATVGFTNWWLGRIGAPEESENRYAQAKDYAERALAIDNSLAWAIGLEAMVAGSQGRYSEGAAIARRGFELNPGSADARAFLGVALARASQYIEAIEHFRGAMSLNPLCPHWYRSNLARALTMIGELDEALLLINDILADEAGHAVARVLKIYIFSQLKDFQSAKEALRELRQFAPNLRLENVPGVLMIQDSETTKRFIESLRNVQFPE